MEIDEKTPKWTDGSKYFYKPPGDMNEKPQGANAARLVKYGPDPMGLFDTSKDKKYEFFCKRSKGTQCYGPTLAGSVRGNTGPVTEGHCN
jgi:hypothetical protein